MLIVTFVKSDAREAESENANISSNIRALGLDLNSDYPIVVQYRHPSKTNPTATYGYAVEEFVTKPNGAPVRGAQDITNLFDVLIRGGYTESQLAAGMPGLRSSTGALVTRFLAKPTKGTDLFKGLEVALV